MVPTRQMNLFPSTSVDRVFGTRLADAGHHIQHVDIGDITFLSCMRESVHRWYRLTPSFGPGLVRFFLKHYGITSSHLVLDPFAGRGTTLIECQKAGVRCLGFEINPLLQAVAERSLVWQPVNSGLFQEFLTEFEARLADVTGRDPYMVARDLGTQVPPIRDVFRWWRPQVIGPLLLARQLMREERLSPIIHYLWLAVNSCALDCANVKKGHPTITFDDHNHRHIDVLTCLAVRVREIQEDLESLSPGEAANVGLARSVLGDSCVDMGLPSGVAGPVTHVITSPPYPNRYSYVHQTRPQLFFMQLVSSASEATTIDLNAVGGTWGKATSILMSTEVEPRDALLPILDYTEELRPRSLLMWNYATKYFIDLDRHLSSLRRVVGRGVRGTYVVGNSRLKGVDIHTEAILCRLLELHGFDVESVMCFRRRGGKKRLYETAVCFRA
ncbi:MAG: site-specific DNA-methyltransferase [Planctomycetes bacterium]|nr:site-specific DNA-methyltransferase [Planctomycetota bacterium]